MPSPKASRYIFAPFIVVIVALIGGVLFFRHTKSSQHRLSPQPSQSTAGNKGNSTAPVVVNPDAPSGWNRYVNETYGYSIEYPRDWTYREFPDGQGAGFRPVNSPDSISSESIDVSETGRPLLECNIPFLTYLQTYGPQFIQDYDLLDSLVPIKTNDGVTGYTLTWGRDAQAGGNPERAPSPSLPITYFKDVSQPTCANDTGMVEVNLNDPNSVPIYNQMILTLTLK